MTTTTDTIKALCDALSDHKIIEFAISAGIPENVLRQGMPYGYRDEVIAMVRALTADASDQAPIQPDCDFMWENAVIMARHVYQGDLIGEQVVDYIEAVVDAAKRLNPIAPVAATLAPTEGWLIEWEDTHGKRRKVCGHNAVADYCAMGYEGVTACELVRRAAPAAPIAEVTGAVGKFSEFRDGKWHTRVVDMTEPAAEHAKPEPAPTSTTSRPAAGSESNQSLSAGNTPFGQHSTTTPAPGVAHAKLAEGLTETAVDHWMGEYDVVLSKHAYNALLKLGQQAGAVDGEASDAMLHAGGEVLYGHSRADAVEWAKADKFDSCQDQAGAVYKAMRAASAAQGGSDADHPDA